MKTKIRKTLALLLMLALVTTLLPFGALAEDTTIDKLETGSITVTKYATENGTRPGNPGTGMSGQTLPENSGYSPLQGATFKLFKIADADAVETYYNGLSEVQYDLANFSYDEDTGAASYGTATIDAADIKSGTTSADGTYKFENLAVGIYVLKEVTAPDQITAPLAETSLISIPMVNTATSSNNGNAKWMYDVFVYPKNHAATGTLELTKQDENGAVLGNVVFKLYKKEFDENGNLPAGEDTWEAVLSTSPDAGVTVNSLTLTTDAATGKLTLASLPAGLHGTQYKLVEVYEAGTSPEGYIINTKPLYFQVLPNNSIRWNDEEGITPSADVLKNENIGVTSTSVSGTTLSITLKNEHPSLTKEVNANGFGQTEFDTHAQYRMDESITYKLTVEVPANVTQMKTFKITDTPDKGIHDSLEHIQISVPVDATTNTQLNKDTDFSARVNQVDGKGTGFVVEFTAAGLQAIAGKTITITYTAALTADAVIANGGNENAATLTYSKYANDPANDEVYTITDHARVYTYEYQITKQLKDAAAGEMPVGVEFQLLDRDKSAIVNVVSLNQDASGNDIGGKYRLALVGETGINTMKTGEGGILIIQGLKSQDYYLKETKTVANYNLLSGPFLIQVDVKETVTWTQGGGFVGNGSTVKSYAETTYEMKQNGGNYATVTDPKGTSTIINKKGFVLPQTGSMGYLLFCAVGLVLIAGGTVLIFGGRKKKIR